MVHSCWKPGFFLLSRLLSDVSSKDEGIVQSLNLALGWLSQRSSMGRPSSSMEGELGSVAGGVWKGWGLSTESEIA